MNDGERDLGPLLADAGILMFEYDVEGSLLTATGSCLGGPDPSMEVRAGLVTPSAVRRASAGEILVDEVRIGGRTIAVRHEPVRDENGAVARVVATACDVGRVSSDPRLMGLAAAS